MLFLYSLLLVGIGVTLMVKSQTKPYFFCGFAFFVIGCFFRGLV